MNGCVKVLLFTENFNIRRRIKGLSQQISTQSLWNLLKRLKIKSKFSENLPYAVLKELWRLCGLHGYSVASRKIYFIMP